MFNFLLCTVSIRVSACISNQTFVYCRVLPCIPFFVVYYPINYRVCSLVYENTRYTKISCIKSETLFVSSILTYLCG